MLYAMTHSDAKLLVLVLVLFACRHAPAPIPVAVRGAPAEEAELAGLLKPDIETGGTMRFDTVPMPASGRDADAHRARFLAGEPLFAEVHLGKAVEAFAGPRAVLKVHIELMAGGGFPPSAWTSTCQDYAVSDENANFAKFGLGHRFGQSQRNQPD